MDEELSMGGGPWPPFGPPRNRKSRSSHTKSRTGCVTCKSRRVKCDETRPVCNNCSSRRIECSYSLEPDLTFVLDIGESSRLFPSSSTVEALARDNVLPTSDDARLPDTQVLPQMQELYLANPSASKKRTHRDQLDSNDGDGLSFLLSDSGSQAATGDISIHPPEPQSLESMSWGGMASFNLLSGFITKTYATLSLIEMKQQVWKDVVVELSSTSECLMHSLLAVSAAHMNYLEDKSRPDAEHSSHVEASTLHHNLAVSLMRKEVASLSEDNVEHIFAASTVLVAYSFATSRAISNQDGPQLEWPNLEWFRLTRGISSITAQVWPALRMGPLRRLMDIRIIHEEWKAHVEGRIALHREPSVPIQLPQPTYMHLKELGSMDSRHPKPNLQPDATSSSSRSGNPADPSHSCEPARVPSAVTSSLLFNQLTSFRRSTESAISKILAICDAEAKKAEKGKATVEVREGDASASSGVGVEQMSTARAQIGIHAACRVLKDLYIRILLMFQHSSFSPRRTNRSKSSNDEACTQALQEIEEVGGLAWPAMVPEDYVRELSQTIPNADVLKGEGLKMRSRLRCNRAKALVILAYYKVLLVLLESGFWWLDNFGALGISLIATEVEESFGESIELCTTIETSGDGPVADLGAAIGRVKSEAEVWVGLLEWPKSFISS
ncbi:hypothetical protein BKA61DRAFT_700273 [Leptodontidium sp. MPI-SDFR-AT-0119]|nr:hypothetical protein BKA61DRAFT_700273 [Leptodontidium sp. MPI-SDFR-AT-0119]